MAREILHGHGEGSWGGCKGDEMELKDVSGAGVFSEVMGELRSLREGVVWLSGVEIGSEGGVVSGE